MAIFHGRAYNMRRSFNRSTVWSSNSQATTKVVEAMQLVLIPPTRGKGIGGTQERSTCSCDCANGWVPEID